MTPIFLAKNSFAAASICFATLAGLSCSGDYSSIVDDWEDEGWQVVEEFGSVGAYTHYTDLKNERAQAVEASWVINGERKTKLYQQSSKRYLVLRFERTDGDVFAVVMSKRR